MTDPQMTPDAARLLESSPRSDGAARLAAATSIDVPVQDGSIRVYHIGGRADSRPIVFVSGWGAVPDSFYDLFGGLAPDADLFHIETREKSSSSINRRTADFTMDVFARDVAAVLDSLQLNGREPVLAGGCFGAAVVIHGLARKILTAPTIVCLDPMTTLWFPHWIVRWLGPVLPAFVFRMLRPLIRSVVLAGMREPVQRARAREFIDSATVWKWRRAAMGVVDWNLFDIAPLVREPVYILNGSHDRFHHADLFPSVARALADGRFVYIPVGEHRRERLMGVVLSAFATRLPGEGAPPELSGFLVPASNE